MERVHLGIPKALKLGLSQPKIFHIGKRVRLADAEPNEENVGAAVAHCARLLVILLSCRVPPGNTSSMTKDLNATLLTAETSLFLQGLSGVLSPSQSYGRLLAYRALPRTLPSQRLPEDKSCQHCHLLLSPTFCCCLLQP